MMRNNIFENDHRVVKRVPRPMLGFKSFEQPEIHIRLFGQRSLLHQNLHRTVTPQKHSESLPTDQAGSPPAPGVGELLERSTAALTTGACEAGLADALVALSAACAPRDRQRALSLVLEHAWRGGDLAAAYQAGLDAADAWQRLDALEASKALCLHSLVCADLGAFGESLITATHAFEVAEAVGSLPRMAVALNAVGTAHHRMGNNVQ